MLLGQAVLPLQLLHLLLPGGIGPAVRIGPLTGRPVIAAVGQIARQRAQARGARDGQLDHIAQEAQHFHGAVEFFLLPAGGLLLLRRIVAIQGVQPVQVILILPVVLRIGRVVGVAFLLQLGVIIGQLIVVEVLVVLFPDTQLVQLGHQLLAAARVGIQRQPI